MQNRITKYSTGKNGINNREQNIGEIIEDKVPVEMANIQTKTKQQDNDIVGNKTSNYQQEKEVDKVMDKVKKSGRIKVQ